jgi:hypothetical protein
MSISAEEEFFWLTSPSEGGCGVFVSLMARGIEMTESRSGESRMMKLKEGCFSERDLVPGLWRTICKRYYLRGRLPVISRVMAEAISGNVTFNAIVENGEHKKDLSDYARAKKIPDLCSEREEVLQRYAREGVPDDVTFEAVFTLPAIFVLSDMRLVSPYPESEEDQKNAEASFILTNFRSALRAVKTKEVRSSHSEVSDSEGDEGGRRPLKKAKREKHVLHLQLPDCYSAESLLPEIIPRKADLDDGDREMRFLSHLFERTKSEWKIEEDCKFSLASATLKQGWGHLRKGTFIHQIAFELDTGRFGFLVNSAEAYLGDIRLGLGDPTITSIVQN